MKCPAVPPFRSAVVLFTNEERAHAARAKDQPIKKRLGLDESLAPGPAVHKNSWDPWQEMGGVGGGAKSGVGLILGLWGGILCHGSQELEAGPGSTGVQ